MCTLTETWLSADDAAVKAECFPTGYKIYNYPRNSREGDGIALVARQGLLVSLEKTDTLWSFEFVELETTAYRIIQPSGSMVPELSFIHISESTYQFKPV